MLKMHLAVSLLTVNIGLPNNSIRLARSSFSESCLMSESKLYLLARLASTFRMGIMLEWAWTVSVLSMVCSERCMWRHSRGACVRSSSQATVATVAASAPEAFFCPMSLGINAPYSWRAAFLKTFNEWLVKICQ